MQFNDHEPTFVTLYDRFPTSVVGGGEQVTTNGTVVVHPRPVPTAGFFGFFTVLDPWRRVCKMAQDRSLFSVHVQHHRERNSGKSALWSFFLAELMFHCLASTKHQAVTNSSTESSLLVHQFFTISMDASANTYNQLALCAPCHKHRTNQRSANDQHQSPFSEQTRPTQWHTSARPKPPRFHSSLSLVSSITELCAQIS